MDHPPLQDIDLDAALRTILEGTATETGEQFFKALVKKLAAALNTHGAWVTEYFPESRRLKALAFWMGGQWLKDWEMVVDGTPCERVINERCLIHIPDNLLDIYGDDPDVQSSGRGELYGHATARCRWQDPRPSGGSRHAAHASQPRAQAAVSNFRSTGRSRIAPHEGEAQVREHEQKLGRLVGSAMDAIIELDQHLKSTQINPAAEKVFGCFAASVDRADLHSFS